MLSDELLIQRHFSESLELLRKEVLGSIFWVLLLPTFLFLVVKKVLFRRVVGFQMHGQVALGCGNSLGHLSWSPCHHRVIFPDVPNLIFQLLLSILRFLLKCLHPTLLECLDDLADLHALPARWLEPAFGLITIEWVNELLLVVEFYVEIEGVDVGIGELASAHSLDELEITLRELHVPVIEIITDLLPPILVVLSLYELVQLVLLNHLGNFLTLDIIALMIVEVVPVSWDISSSKKHLLIRRVI